MHDVPWLKSGPYQLPLHPWLQGEHTDVVLEPQNVLECLLISVWWCTDESVYHQLQLLVVN